MATNPSLRDSSRYCTLSAYNGYNRRTSSYKTISPWSNDQGLIGSMGEDLLRAGFIVFAIFLTRNKGKSLFL